jgi:hypothetical protein
VSAGSDRLLLVGVYGEDSGVASSVATVTWGGQTLTEIDEVVVGTGYSNLAWLGYLDETGIAGATGSTIVATWSGTTPNESVLYSAVTLENVDQATPIGGSSTGTALNTSTVQPAGALNVDTDDLAVYVTASGAQGETHTPASGYVEGTEQDSGGVGQVAATATKPITVTGTEQPVANWINPNNRLAIISTVINVVGSTPPSAVLSGTVVPTVTETETETGGETLIITLTADTWDATIGADNAKTTALINGIDSAQSEATGWDAVVKAGLTFNEVTRTSDTVVTITLGAEPGYEITAGETITVTVPATAVASGGPITATPTFDVIAGSGCSPTSTTYDFAGVSSPSSTHTAEDGEIDETDTVIENGTFSARRNTIGGWANWGEATTAEYSNLVGSDNLYYQGANPGNGDNAAMIFEFTTAEDPSCITQIDVNVEAAQGGNPFSDLWLVYLWDYTTSSYLVGGSMNGTTDQVVSFSVTTNPGDYIQTSDGQLTVFVVNEDTAGEIRIDDITVTISRG